MMAALSYTRKGPDIEAYKFVYLGTNLTEVQDWLDQGLTEDYEVVPSTTGPAMLVQHAEAPTLVVNNGEYLVKDSNGKIFKMTDQLLFAFYNLVS